MGTRKKSSYPIYSSVEEFYLKNLNNRNKDYFRYDKEKKVIRCTTKSKTCKAMADEMTSYYKDTNKAFQNPEEIKENLNAGYSVARQPTQEERIQYPYMEDDKETGSLDSWDMEKQYKNYQKDKLVYSGGIDRYELDKQKKEGKISAQDYDKKIKETNGKISYNDLMNKYKGKVGVGAYIGLGAAGNHAKGKDALASHTVRVVGFLDSGEPLVADYGKVVPLSKAMYIGMSGKDSPQISYIGNQPGTTNDTFDYYSANKPVQESPITNTPYISDFTKLPIYDKKTGEYKYVEGSPRFKKLHDDLVKDKQVIMDAKGLSSEEYDKLAKSVLTLAGQETNYGTHNLSGSFFDMFKSSKGVTSLRRENTAPYVNNILKLTQGDRDTTGAILYASDLSSKLQKEFIPEDGTNTGMRVFRKHLPSAVKNALRGRREKGYVQNLFSNNNFVDGDLSVELPSKGLFEDDASYDVKAQNAINNKAGNNSYIVKGDKITKVTDGNKIAPSAENLLFYGWQSPGIVIGGDADGDSNYYQQNKANYNKLFNTNLNTFAMGGKLNNCNCPTHTNRTLKSYACGGKLARPSSRKRNIIPALTLGMSVASSIFGAVAKAKEAKKQKREQERQAFANLNNQFLEQSRGDNLAYMQSDEDGNSDVQYYANGGKLNNLAPQTLGGDLVPIGDGVEEVVGNKHNQTTIDGVSGVQLLENGQPTAEVENGEVIVDGDRVLSNRLMFDANNSYADKMKQLTKKRNKLEAMQEKAKGYRAKNTIERKLASLNAAESTLFQHQEETKYAEGMNELQNVEGTPSFRWGGKTPIPTPFKNNAKDLIFPKTDYGAILNRRLPQLATTELTDPVVSPNAEVKEKSMDEVVLTKKKPAAPPVNATNPLGYAMNPVTADFKVPDTNVHYTPPPSKLDSFLASDAGQFVSTVAPMLIDNVGNAIASKNTPKLPTPLLQYARPLETRVNINPQLAEVRRSNKSIKDTILSNTSNSNTARNAVVSANLSADKQVMDLYGGKENQELQLRNANVQQQQMVDNQNAATLNQHSMNVYQRANDIASKSSANLANLAGDITNASQMVKTDKNFKAYTNANLLDDAEGSKLATYLNNDEYLKDPRNRAFVKSLLSNPYTANKYKHLMPRAQQLGLVN